MKDHTAAARETIAANLARVTAARRQAVLHGEAHMRVIHRRHDEVGAELERLEDQLGADPRGWGPAELHSLDHAQRERRELAQLIGSSESKGKGG